MTIETWLADACADAERRGLPELKPLLAALADSTRALRSVDWDSARSPDGPASSPERTARDASGTAHDGADGAHASDEATR